MRGSETPTQLHLCVGAAVESPPPAACSAAPKVARRVGETFSIFALIAEALSQGSKTEIGEQWHRPKSIILNERVDSFH